MSLAISPLSLLPALFNSLHSRLNNLINAMSVFNPAPFSHKLSRENTAIAVQNLPGSPKFYLSATATRRLWGNMNTIRGGLWAADHLHSAPCRAGLWLPKNYTATTELRKKVKMWKIKTLPGLCSSTATAIERLVFSHSKSTNPVAGKALQEHTLSLLGWILDDDISKSKMSAIKPLTCCCCFYCMHFKNEIIMAQLLILTGELLEFLIC